MLTIRGLQIVVKLLDAKTPIRIKELSDEFSVSTRTIKYDLENVRGWLKENLVELHSQPNKGIWIICHDNKRMELRNNLTQFERNSLYPDQTIRVRRIIMCLLLSNDYVTSADLADRLEVSRNTTLNDLNQVVEFVNPWMIKLERKRRIGYKLLGSEFDLRLLFEHMIHTELSNYEIYKMMTRITKKENNLDGEPSMDKTLLAIYKVTEQHMSNLFTASLSQSFHHSDLVSILFRLTISVTRLNMGSTIKGYRILNKVKPKDDASLFLFTLMDKVYEEMQLPLLEDEYLYISGKIDNDTTQVDLLKVTQSIIQHVSQKEGIDYKRDSKLFSNLFAHLSVRFQKGTFSFVEMNPFTDEIKQNHPSLFQSIQEACQDHIGTQAIIAQDSFISFIALHFLVSFENTFNSKKKVRALYVCSTGRGVARLIKNRVEREILDIDIVTYCSIMEVDHICQKEAVDVIVSVFPIESNIPVVVVEPSPTKRDMEVLQEKVNQLIKKETQQLNHLLINEEIDELNEDSETISQEIILKGFEMIQEIFTTFPDEIVENRKQAFMLHVFLMVHRCYFDKQYDHYLYTNQELIDKNDKYLEKIQSILNEKELVIHEAEMSALLQYLK